MRKFIAVGFLFYLWMLLLTTNAQISSIPTRSTISQAYQTIADEGSNLTQRNKLNFIGSSVSCVDNAGATRTDCTVSGNITTSDSDPVGACTPGDGVLNTSSQSLWICTASGTWKQALLSDGTGTAVITFLEGTFPSAPSLSGQHNVAFDSSDSRLKSIENGASAPTIYVTESGVNAQSGTTYTYLSTDRQKLVTHTNGSSIAGTLPQAGSSFPSGWWIDVQNRGVGTLTITPTTSTIDGASSLALTTSQGVRIVSDGTNYYTMRGKSTSSSTKVLDEYRIPLGITDSGAGTSTPNCKPSGGAISTGDSSYASGLEFPNSSTPAVSCAFRIPTNWDGSAMTVYVGGWIRGSGGASGVVGLRFYSVCPSSGSTFEPSYGSATNLNIATSTQTALDHYAGSVSVTPDASCSAGEMMTYKIDRNTGVGSNYAAGFVAGEGTINFDRSLE